MIDDAIVTPAESRRGKYWCWRILELTASENAALPIADALSAADVKTINARNEKHDANGVFRTHNEWAEMLKKHCAS